MTKTKILKFVKLEILVIMNTDPVVLVNLETILETLNMKQVYILDWVWTHLWPHTFTYIHAYGKYRLANTLTFGLLEKNVRTQGNPRESMQFIEHEVNRPLDLGALRLNCFPLLHHAPCSSYTLGFYYNITQRQWK